MKSINEISSKSMATAEQLEHRLQLLKYAKQKRQRELHNALVFKVGELVLSCWPWVSRLQVRRKKTENETEFAPLRDLLLKVADSEQYTIVRSVIANRTETPDE